MNIIYFENVSEITKISQMNNMNNINSIVRRAYAKINLALDVICRRPDGYHEVKMIMQTIGIYDELKLEKITANEKSINNSLDKPLPIKITTDSSELKADESNIIYRAASAIFGHYHPAGGVKITLKKNIPISAGMAGGSTDAAAVFHGLNELFDLKMTIAEMCDIGVKIGADVPYCIIGGTALAEGIGEKLTSLPAPPPCHVLIAKPKISVSTKWVYENLHVNDLKYHPDIDGMVTAINHHDLSGITSRMENVLESVTTEKYPLIKKIKTIMMAHGAENALMSGSGPTVFGIFIDEKKAECAYNKLENEFETFLTTFIN